VSKWASLAPPRLHGNGGRRRVTSRGTRGSGLIQQLDDPFAGCALQNRLPGLVFISRPGAVPQQRKNDLALLGARRERIRIGASFNRALHNRYLRYGVPRRGVRAGIRRVVSAWAPRRFLAWKLAPLASKLSVMARRRCCTRRRKCVADLSDSFYEDLFVKSFLIAASMGGTSWAPHEGA